MSSSPFFLPTFFYIPHWSYIVPCHWRRGGTALGRGSNRCFRPTTIVFSPLGCRSFVLPLWILENTRRNTRKCRITTEWIVGTESRPWTWLILIIHKAPWPLPYLVVFILLVFHLL
jgi:hypothetical protein